MTDCIQQLIQRSCRLHLLQHCQVERGHQIGVLLMVVSQQLLVADLCTAGIERCREVSGDFCCFFDQFNCTAVERQRLLQTLAVLFDLPAH